MAKTAHGTPPNILIIQVDQLAPQALPARGHDLVKAPNIPALAADGLTTKAKARFPFVESTAFER